MPHNPNYPNQCNVILKNFATDPTGNRFVIINLVETRPANVLYVIPQKKNMADF